MACPDDMHCTQVVLNDKVTPDIDWDDPTFGICTYGAEGRPCELDTPGWCDEGLACNAQEAESFPEGVGFCGEAPCEPSCGDFVCGDDGCGGTCGDCEAGFGCTIGACDPICSDTCSDNATCTAPDTCTCNEGWSGEDCSTAVCAEECINNSSCTAPDTCTCDEGYEGEGCDTPICSETCGDNASCTAPDTCTCDEGLVGDACQYSDATTCNGNGAAQEDGACLCNEGFEGSDCSSLAACSTALGCIDVPGVDDSDCAGGVCTTFLTLSLFGEDFTSETSCQVHCSGSDVLPEVVLPDCPDGYSCQGVTMPADPESDLPFNQSVGVCEKHPDDGSVLLGDTCHEDAHCVSGICQTGDLCIVGDCGGFCTQECMPPDSTEPEVPCPEGFECQTFISELEPIKHFCIGSLGEFPIIPLD